MRSGSLRSSFATARVLNTVTTKDVIFNPKTHVTVFVKVGVR
jgi:hypothetical protein